MSAQKTPRRGIFSAAAGLLGFSALAGLLVTVMVAPAVAVTGIGASSAIGVFDSIPDYIKLDQLSQRNEIYANSNAGPVLIATIYNQNRQEVGYDQISKFALDATVDGEDARFFEHGGVDVASVARAAIGQLTGTSDSGASTLSMQLVKNTFVQEALEKPTEEERDAAYKVATSKTFDRKLKEMKLAIGLEKQYTKKEILTAYLNIANFGNATYGIQAAAQRYYSVDAKDLTLPQAASLIAIVQQPSARNPGDPENWAANQERRDFILGRMLELGDITQQEHDDAVAVPVNENTVIPKPPTQGCTYGDDYGKWFCDYVVRSVPDFAFLGDTPADRKANWKRGGYKLYTTLDMDLQRPAQDAVWAYAPNTETAFALGSVANTVQAGTGRVLVMAENMIFNDTLEGGGPGTSAVNYSTSVDYGGSTGFQPGSTYKLFTLLDWLMKGKGTEERVNGNPDTQSKYSDYKACGAPLSGGTFSYKNNAGEGGSWTVRNGTVESVNGVFFSMAKQLDLCDIRDIAKSLGVVRADNTELQTNPTSIIGTNEVTPLSMAGAYAAISAQGKFCKTIIVDSAVTPDGQTVPGQPQECAQVIPQNVADTAIDVMKGVLTTGNGAYSNADDGIPVFGKTGTTDVGDQTWVATGTTSAASISWVGNSVGKYSILDTEYNDVAGIRLRHYIMHDINVALNNKYGGTEWPGPDPALVTGSGVSVPDVRGQTPEAAKALLEGLGFSYADGGPSDSDVTAGRVSGTDPGAGATSAKGSIITVYTSKGNVVPFPNVVGDGKSFDFNSAKSQLVAAGYPASGITQACAVLAPTTNNPGPPDPDLVDPTDPRINKVQSTNPSPGTPVVPGGAVTITIGKITC